MCDDDDDDDDDDDESKKCCVKKISDELIKLVQKSWKIDHRKKTNNSNLQTNDSVGESDVVVVTDNQGRPSFASYF